MTKANRKPASAAQLAVQKSQKMALVTNVKRPKSQIVIDSLARVEGATVDELCQATNWQPHSTRAFLTGLKTKGYAISSDKVDGVRRYRAVFVTKAEAA